MDKGAKMKPIWFVENGDSFCPIDYTCREQLYRYHKDKTFRLAYGSYLGYNHYAIDYDYIPKNNYVNHYPIQGRFCTKELSFGTFKPKIVDVPMTDQMFYNFLSEDEVISCIELHINKRMCIASWEMLLARAELKAAVYNYDESMPLNLSPEEYPKWNKIEYAETMVLTYMARLVHNKLKLFGFTAEQKIDAEQCDTGAIDWLDRLFYRNSDYRPITKKLNRYFELWKEARRMGWNYTQIQQKSYHYCIENPWPSLENLKEGINV